MLERMCTGLQGRGLVGCSGRLHGAGALGRALITWMTPPTRSLPSAVALTRAPAASTRARSDGMLAVCSALRVSSSSSRHSTQRQSPALATKATPGKHNAASAVQPESSAALPITKPSCSDTKAARSAPTARDDAG